MGLHVLWAAWCVFLSLPQRNVYSRPSSTFMLDFGRGCCVVWALSAVDIGPLAEIRFANVFPLPEYLFILLCWAPLLCRSVDG